MKRSHKLWVRMDGTQFLQLYWFPAKNNPPQTFLGGVKVFLQVLYISYKFSIDFFSVLLKSIALEFLSIDLLAGWSVVLRHLKMVARY